MPSIDELLPGLSAVPVVGILRGCPVHLAPPVATAAREAGLKVIEVTLDSPAALDQVAAVLELGLDMLIGVGTVTRPQQVIEAVAAGAQFVVSPVVRDVVVRECIAMGLPCVPGAATPTEIARAIELGAAAVKVFPAASLGGPGFLAAVAGPLGNPPLIPTGGVELDNAIRYFAAGAVAVGVGSAMFSADALGRGDADRVRADVRRWVEVVAP
jgi:2-dehydro-3-deoxyphosphogluconate aldolase / (4S)-4-hydroxy-2-oxoglutarate aldolase